VKWTRRDAASTFLGRILFFKQLYEGSNVGILDDQRAGSVLAPNDASFRPDLYSGFLQPRIQCVDAFCLKADAIYGDIGRQISIVTDNVYKVVALCNIRLSGNFAMEWVELPICKKVFVRISPRTLLVF